MFVPQPDGIVGGHVKFVVQALWSLILMVGGLPAVGDVSRSLTQGSRSLIIEISGRVRAEAGPRVPGALKMNTRHTLVTPCRYYMCVCVHI